MLFEVTIFLNYGNFKKKPQMRFCNKGNIFINYSTGSKPLKTPPMNSKTIYKFKFWTFWIRWRQLCRQKPKQFKRFPAKIIGAHRPYKWGIIQSAFPFETSQKLPLPSKHSLDVFYGLKLALLNCLGAIEGDFSWNKVSTKQRRKFPSVVYDGKQGSLGRRLSINYEVLFDD